ncbi:hypothetical protein BVRB_6g135620 [Beta vulgaris subsp. vulgaris]|nr:hypothetical protein BVRB_6g135620 [Beta vulgaris subsp. vulgaris]
MADIAILVAEEYERRVNIGKKRSVDEAKTMSSSSPIQWLREHKLFHETHIQIKVVDPKSQMGVAALDGLFSA